MELRSVRLGSPQGETRGIRRRQGYGVSPGPETGPRLCLFNGSVFFYAKAMAYSIVRCGSIFWLLDGAAGVRDASVRLCGGDLFRVREKEESDLSFLPVLVHQPLVRRQFAEELHTVEIVDYVLV